ncbi:hypothetical protein PUN28_018255 [Cardiocondyla obscurior]|uniref:Uncharacterized protein n=1 Tax=Cardiocondyla obscurior TaxID=286306 RepID=A0AAW2EGK5_9HYME
MHVITVAWKSTYIALTRLYPGRRQRLVARGISIATGERCRVHYAHRIRADPLAPPRLTPRTSRSFSLHQKVNFKVATLAINVIRFYFLQRNDLEFNLTTRVWRLMNNAVGKWSRPTERIDATQRMSLALHVDINFGFASAMVVPVNPVCLSIRESSNATFMLSDKKKDVQFLFKFYFKKFPRRGSGSLCTLE